MGPKTEKGRTPVTKLTNAPPLSLFLSSLSLRLLVDNFRAVDRVTSSYWRSPTRPGQSSRLPASTPLTPLLPQKMDAPPGPLQSYPSIPYPPPQAPAAFIPARRAREAEETSNAVCPLLPLVAFSRRSRTDSGSKEVAQIHHPVQASSSRPSLLPSSSPFVRSHLLLPRSSPPSTP